MKTNLLDQIPFQIDLDGLMKRMRVRPNSQDARDLAALAAEAEKIACPKAFYGAAQIEQRNDEGVIVSGVSFSSRVLRVNLDQAEQIFPFVATCGMELQTWGDGLEDMIWSFWAEAVKEDALRAALGALQDHLRNSFHLGHFSTMSPGSLENWPISQQTPLFNLLGNPSEVRLTDSLLMVPTKSVSGFIFPIEADFESCQLCPRTDCPGRRAPYDETLYARKYCPAG